MYSDALNYHIYGVLLLVITITLFYLYTQMHKDFNNYKKYIRIWTPIYFFAFASSIFTGIIMMAAKHLEFTVANNAMILTSFLIIFLEIVRFKKMKTSPSSESALYTVFAKRIYAIELILLFGVVYLAKLLH